MAMLQVENVFLHWKTAQSGKGQAAKRKFEAKEGDLITLLNVYRLQKLFFTMVISK